MFECFQIVVKMIKGVKSSIQSPITNKRMLSKLIIIDNIKNNFQKKIIKKNSIELDFESSKILNYT